VPNTFPIQGPDPLAQDLESQDESLGHLWRQRSIWQVRLRWAVPPTIFACVGFGLLIGFRFAWVPLATVAFGILSYNACLALLLNAIPPNSRGRYAVDLGLAVVQVSLDYAALLTMLHYTGGVASPLLFFLAFHVVFAAMLFRANAAYVFAAAASTATALLALVELTGLLPTHPVWFKGNTLTLTDRPGHVMAILLVFSAAVFVTAGVSNMIMAHLRKGVISLAQATRRATTLTNKLGSLHVMVEAVSAQRVLDNVLRTVVAELTKVTEVDGITVALANEDDARLRYAAIHGLPAGFDQDHTLDESLGPCSQRVMQGETVVLEQITDKNGSCSLDELAAAGMQSALLAPLMVGERSIGMLGAYCHAPNRFGEEDIALFRHAAELVGIAIDDARQAEAIDRLMRERTRLMLQVAHNLRAPLSASITMLETITGAYLGPLSDRQAEYLARISRRLTFMQRTIDEMLALANAHRALPAQAASDVALGEVVSEVTSMFRAEAERKRLQLDMSCAEALPTLRGDAELLRQLLENLLSNALKYTPEGGRVTVNLGASGAGELVLEVRDTGIGIPVAEQEHLFTEFFRASNARKAHEHGTGLGLPIVKQIAELHGGEVLVDSAQNQGTRVVVTFHNG
jgi:two-component system, OmpR family, phosphate regulon sensor histidine kinase PhoR